MDQKWIYSDGGRSEYFKGTAGDCGPRAAAIVLEKDYKEVYDELNEIQSMWIEEKRNKVRNKEKWKHLFKQDTSVRTGTWPEVMKEYMKRNGYEWVPTMKPGQGCKVHLNSEELPSSRILLSVSKHYTAMIDGVIYDTHDCSREGTRCVYGYFIKQ